jgi:hypothetical protein
MVGAGDNYHPLIRNHHYELTITGVISEGYTTAANASKSITTQLSTVFLAWDDKKQNVVIDNTSYLFNVAPTEVYLSNTVFVEDVYIETNYPGVTWEVSQPTVDWFKVTLFDPHSSSNVIYITRIKQPSSAADMTGYFSIKLKDGNKLKVSQQIKVEYK